MNNSSEVTYFILAAYGDIGSLKHLYFIIILVWYLFICVSNLFLIVVIFVDRRLHEPMYIIVCNLFVSEISGSTALYPLLLFQMFSETHQVSLNMCFLQMFHIYTSASVEFVTLAAMAYDRYVSICRPFYYHILMTNRRAIVIVVLIWSYSVANVLFMCFVIIQVTFCGNSIDKVFCDHHMIIRLACSATTVSKLSDIFFAIVTMAIPLSLIAVSYMKILRVCLNTNTENKQKAITTCAPQIVSLSNLFIGCVFHFAESRFDQIQVPGQVRVVLSVYLLVCQPVITPYMYGFGLSKIRQSCKKFRLSIKVQISTLNPSITNRKHVA